MQPARPGEVLGVFERFLEVAAMDDELRPLASIAAFFSRLLPRGTTTTASSPASPAATAMLWPKLPRVAAITPAASAARGAAGR